MSGISDLVLDMSIDGFMKNMGTWCMRNRRLTDRAIVHISAPDLMKFWPSTLNDDTCQNRVVVSSRIETVFDCVS